VPQSDAVVRIVIYPIKPCKINVPNRFVMHYAKINKKSNFQYLNRLNCYEKYIYTYKYPPTASHREIVPLLTFKFHSNDIIT